MLFQEAMDALIQGNYATRDVWTDGSYVIFLPGTVSVFKVTVQPQTNIGPFAWLMADFKADDWQVYNKREDVPPPKAA